MKCSICGGTKKSGYVQRLIAEGKLDPSKVSNPSVFITNLGKAHQKRIDDLASTKKHEMKWYDHKYWTDGRFEYELMPGTQSRNVRFLKNLTSIAEQNRTGILQGKTYAALGHNIRNTKDDSPPARLKKENLTPIEALTKPKVVEEVKKELPTASDLEKKEKKRLFKLNFMKEQEAKRLKA